MATLAFRGWFLRALLPAALIAAGAARAEPDSQAGDEPPAAFELTPPRLSLVEGEVSFWRPGAEAWAPARPNLALAAGDRLYAEEDSNLEIQIGPRAFVRAGERAELGVEALEPDFLQLRIASGTASLDVRSLPPAHTIELATPHAAITIEETGYYRTEVEEHTTTLSCGRSGSATLTPSEGAAVVVGPSEQGIVTDGGEDAPSVESHAAPELDDWDRWNYRRTDRLLDSLSTRYVGAHVYGASDLDQYGSWRTVAPYGPIWIPSMVRIGWAPYGFGRWIRDPLFGWTWVDDAPWGWAPFHYGRWVFVHGHWAWVPGAIVVRSYYAPALVVFFGGPHTSPRISWLPLGWGEPCVPWWGPRGWAGQPRWLGWGGPRIVNQGVIAPETAVHVKDLREFENARVPGALVAVQRKKFGLEPVREIRMSDSKPDRLEPLRGALPVATAPASFVGTGEKVRRPPARVLERRVVEAVRRRGSAPALRVPGESDRLLRVPGESTRPSNRLRVPRPEAPERAVPRVGLPGEPANRAYRGHSEGRVQRGRHPDGKAAKPEGGTASQPARPGPLHGDGPDFR